MSLAQKFIGFLIAMLVLFLINTVLIAVLPTLATVERAYVNQTASWGAKLRGQVSSSVGLSPTSTTIYGGR